MNGKLVFSYWLVERGILLSEASKRTDIYLPTGTSMVGIKKHNGSSLEVKSQIRPLVLQIPFADHCEAEICIKHELQGFPVGGASELKIVKTRWPALLDDNGELLCSGQKPLVASYADWLRREAIFEET